MSAYTLDDRIGPVKFYLKYSGYSAAILRELGYPTRNALRQWIRDWEVLMLMVAPCRLA